MINCKLPIINELGLHARAATKLASLAGRYDYSIKNGTEFPLVDAKCIMSFLLLAASQGIELIFEFDGPDEDEACSMITRLLADYFGEGK